MNSQLSVNEIMNSVKGLELSKFEQFYRDLTALRIQKNGMSKLNSIESQLLITVNTEFDPKKWERLTYLDWKLEFGALTTKEEIESLKLAEAYENFSVERLKCLSQLALLRNVSIDTLMEQLGVNTGLNG